MSRGNYRQSIFLDDEHFAKYLSLLQRVANRRKWRILDWCLIPNHFHLLIQLTEDGLSDGMRELNGCYSRWSNLQTGRTGTGHLVRNRFLSKDVLQEGHFWTLAAYIPLNPVAAGLAESPEDWPWSGYRANVGLEYPRPFHQPGKLLRYFSKRPDVAVRRYRELVHDGLVALGEADWSDQDAGPARAPAMVESHT